MVRRFAIVYCSWADPAFTGAGARAIQYHIFDCLTSPVICFGHPEMFFSCLIYQGQLPFISVDLFPIFYRAAGEVTVDGGHK